MQPILVKEVEDSKGSAIEEKEPKVLAESTTPDIAKTLTKYMISVVEDGTGRRAALRSTQVAGKTGTAENASGENHAWFIGFAPAKDPQIAVAIILEQAGKSGGSVAAPIARDIIVYALNNIDFNEVHDLPESDDD